MQVKVSNSSTIEKHPGCVAAAAATIGDKWTPLIILGIASGRSRFSEIQKNLGNISPRTLSQRLDSLEHCHILTKKSYAEVPPRVEYNLTNKGRDLIPILRSMAAWGDKYRA